MARAHTGTAINTLVGIAQNGESEGARVNAADILLSRGWGRPAQPHTGEDGEGDIRITMRTILEGKK